MVMALSWSRINDFRQCPHKFFLKYIEKAPNFMMKDEDKSPHLVRGNNVHKQLEVYVVKKLKNEPVTPTMPEVINTIPLIDRIMANYNVRPESQIAVNDKFEEVSWYSKDAWFRVIYDLIGFGQDLLLGDYKTGKLTDYSGSVNELGQLHMSAVIGMALFPEFEVCNPLYIYVDHKQVIPCVLNRKETFELMKKNLIEEHGKINAEKDFNPKKNQFCGWCSALKEQCKYSKI